MAEFLDRLENNAGSIITGLFVLLALALVFVQIISLIITQIWGVKMLTLGPALALLTVIAVLSAGLIAAIMPNRFDRSTWIAVFILVMVVVFMYWLFPKLAPEFMKPAMSTLKVQTMSFLNL